MLKGDFWSILVLLFLLRSCCSWLVVSGGSPLQWEGLIVDLWFFGDGWHWCILPSGAVVDAGHGTHVAWGGGAG